MFNFMKTARQILTRQILKGVVLLFFAAVPPAAAQGTPAPVLDLSEYHGKVIYLDFWASWCAPCLQSFPWMNEIQRVYGREDLVVVAVNVDHDGSSALRFLANKLPVFKIIYDANGRIAQQFDIKDMPTSILIGRDGKVRYVHSGFVVDREPIYLSHIRELLDAKAN